MTEYLRQGLQLLTPQKRARMFMLVGAMAFGAVLEAMGVAIIVPFVFMLSDPTSALEQARAKPILDFIGIDTTNKLIVLSSLVLLLFYIVRGGYLALMYFALFRFIFRERVQISNLLLSKYIDAPITFHLGRNSNELIKNTTDTMQRYAMGVMMPAMIAVSEALVVAAIVTLLLIVSPGATLTALVIIGVPAVLYYKYVRTRLAVQGRVSEQSLALVMQWIKQSLGGIKMTKLTNSGPYFVARHSRHAEVFATAYSTMTFQSQIPRMLMELFAIGGFVIVTLVLFGRRELQAAIPYFSMFAVAAIRLLPSANRLSANLTNLRFHLPSLTIIYDELQAVKEIPGVEMTAQRGESAGQLELQHALVLRDVSYRYPGADTHAIDGVSLTIPRGSLVAFVGPTAAGKTTIIDLILGLLSPSKGAVLVDGHGIFGNLRAWQRTVGYVPQQIYMIDDSIRRNVAYAIEDADIDDARVWSALDSAEIGDVVRAMPDGLDTLTGEDGARLSGGERQRLGIARALYADADVLVMDEVTASLDAATEKKLADTLVSLRGNKTIVMTAHRIPLMRICDGLFLLRDGRVVASGKYEQLLETSREFQEMVAG